MHDLGVPEELASAVLTVDLDAIAENWRALDHRSPNAVTGGVVKADAYGLGMARVAPALFRAGCRVFFVAHVSEGIDLRALLPGAEIEIHVLNGLVIGAEAAYRAHNLIPVLGSLREIDRWIAYCDGAPLACDLHVDTGMLRLGLPSGELDTLAADHDRLGGLDVRLVMSHFASADECDTPQNDHQLARFKAARAKLPMGRSCFANSAGIFLGGDYHGEVVRPGVALYGINPTPWTANPMRAVATLMARIVQIRDAAPGETVSYGATHTVERPTRIATVAAGYADGYKRSLSGVGQGYIGGRRVPVLGRVTMDLTMFDVTDAAADRCRPGDWIELMGENITVDEVADAAGTIGYEILTGMGRRFHRRYVGGGE